jgi:PAS domain S-box-containing protein
MSPGDGLDVTALREQLRARSEMISTLVAAAESLRSVIEALDGALCIVGDDGSVLDANRRWLQALPPSTGRGAPAGSIGTDFFAWCRSTPGLAELSDEVATVVAEAIEAPVPADAGQAPERSVKGRWRAGDDRRSWVVVRVHQIRDHRRARAVVSMIDITEGMRTQERLHEAISVAEGLAEALSQEKTLLSAVISAVPQLIYWKDAEGRYVGCNAAYLVFRGLCEEADLLGRDEQELTLPDAIGVALDELEHEVIGSGRPVIDRTVELPDRHGDRRSLLLSVLPLDQGGVGRGVIGVGADITHARELERQLAQANRLESIGQLAAGIAHEINTPVQYVADNTHFVAEATSALLAVITQVDQLARTGVRPDGTPAGLADVADLLAPLDLDFLAGEMPGALAESREGLDRVTEIVRAMKDYAHPGTGRAEIDPNRAIESTVHVCRNEWKYVARVELDLDPAAGLVPCFEGDLKQVVLNMIVNAAQAIAEDPRRADGSLGTITISTRRTPSEFLITIRDDGPGMDEKIVHRVFDPFFTTKQVGKGTGQGLSLAHAVVVTKHQGRIDLDTAPGAGATFTVRLPLIVA